MPVSHGAPQQGVSCTGALKMGFMTGCLVGLGAGVVLGGLGGLRAGLRGRELISQVGKASFQSAGTFGTFMGVGLGLRTCI